MFTIAYWNAELAAFDALLEQNAEDPDQINRLCRGLTYLAARVVAQNPAEKQVIVGAVVSRLQRVEALMGRDWFLTRLVEMTCHAMPT